MIAIQATLNSLWHTLSAMKTSETIRDEAGEWSYTISAQAMRDRFKQLVDERNRALEAVAAQGQVTDFFINTLAVRDAQVAAAIEPFAASCGGGLEGDYRFG